MAETAKSTAPPVRDWPQIRAFRTLLRANAKVVEAHRVYLTARHGMVITEFDMIAALGNTKGLNMGELAEKMVTSPGNVTRVAQALQKRGLVERRRAEHSDREVIACLTPAGERFFREHFIEVASFTTALMDSALSAAELKHLADLLAKLSENLRMPAVAAREPRPRRSRDKP
jgi:DNA-binding MarR family transcriptional regulator